ncbi:MAG: hypothetical protein IKI69_06560 [Oscillospiraceae bacterium]|nr:hypothetical protein [Oscillospiraceae bacterium]
MLKKPLIAAILSVLIVLASTLVSVHARLDPICADFRDKFHSSEIPKGLTQYCSYSTEILQLAADAKLQTREAHDSVEALHKALGEDSAAKLFSRYQKLSAAISDVKASLLRSELSEADRQALERLDAALSSAQTQISESDYNSRTSFLLRKELGSFSCFVARLCGVRLPEQFA